MSGPGQEFVEIFLQEASEHLQFLREYAGILQDPYPMPDDLERLYISAHTLSGTSGTYGYPLFSEVAGKLAHIFQYAMNATIAPEASIALVEFISEGIAVLESDLIMVSAQQLEAEEEINFFKSKYPFAFQAASQPEPYSLPVQEELPITEAFESANELATAIDHTSAVVHTYHSPVSLAVSLDQELPEEGDVPAEILEFFIPEAEEHLQIVQDCLLALEAFPNPEDINRLFRAIHTVKGSAAQVGLPRIARVAHRTEDLIGRLRDGLLQPSAEIVDICLESVDILKKFLYRQWTDETAMRSTVRTLLARIARLAPEELEDQEQAPAAVIHEQAYTQSAITLPEQSTAYAEPQRLIISTPASAEPTQLDLVPKDEMDLIVASKQKEIGAMGQSKSVRIALERLDRMMNAVGELVINRTRMLGRVAELERLAEVLNFSKGRMSDKITEFQEKYEFSRLTGAAPQMPVTRPQDLYPYRGGYSSYALGYDNSLAEFSELEMDKYDDFNILSRSLTEISADITEVLTQLDGFVRRVDADIDEFSKLAHRLQDEITQARMVPIGNLYTRLSRTARDAAKAAGKQVDLTLAGAETELDNNIIQQISDPLIHLVRNAVAHGLEKHEERYSLGKTDHGNLAIRAYHRGNHIFIEVEDDGRGIDYEKVRTTAIDLGLIPADDAASLDEKHLLDFLFHPGFSTAPRKTELAGRGVGLDVVRANLASLNGEIEIETERSFGTRFTLKVPLTLIISQALFIRCGKSTFAFPLAFVEEIRRVRADEIEEIGGKLLTKVRDVVTEVVRLDEQLGIDSIEPFNGWYRMVIVNVASRQVGVVVEEVIRKDEIVIKSLGEYMRNVKLFPGATIAPDGNLILLIDVNRLVAGESIEHRPLMTSATAARIFAPGASAVAKGTIPKAAIDEVQPEKVVVLADDSISVRKFVGRMLEKAGYRVRLAADGLEALEIVTQFKCDLVITDLEMPRTNGYELMTHMRQHPETRGVPVMVVTSRAGAKHRERAIKEGAIQFLTKPVQEDQFIAVVEEIIGTGIQKHRLAAPEPATTTGGEA